jgi:hypothetical protein
VQLPTASGPGERPLPDVPTGNRQHCNNGVHAGSGCSISREPRSIRRSPSTSLVDDASHGKHWRGFATKVFGAGMGRHRTLVQLNLTMVQFIG